MAEAKNEFTNLSSLRSEAIGEPGKRTFRLLATSGDSSATIWLEKEQLFQLALGIQQLLARISGEGGQSDPSPAEGGPVPFAQLDFKAGKLVLGHDGRRGLFLIDAHDEEEEDEDSATVRVWADKEQAKDFAHEALRVCASGRPLCPLCGRPMDADGHHCPRLNGHVQPGSL